MLATRAASRIALRFPALRRGIHSAERGNGPRSSAITAGIVIAAAGSAVGTYVSYKSSGNTQSTLGEKYDKIRQKAPEPKSHSAPAKKSAPPKSQSASSVDSPTPAKPSPSEPGVLEPTSQPDSDKPADESSGSSNPDKAGDMDSLESDAANQGAFNPETGEINWDCPCLGGMAHGPCGPHFREAFSCFVHSNQEPKGVDCVEKFKAMQDCFREHPDVYGEEIDDDEETNLDSPDASKESSPTEGRSSTEPAPEKKDKTPSGKKSETHAEKKSEEPAEKKPDAPSAPTKDPESRTRVPTANVSPDATPSKSSAKH